MSNSGAVRYNLSSGPPWLQLDGNSRTFTGTPGVNDVGSPSIQVTASDDNGSIGAPLTLSVSANPPPSLAIPLEDQLARFGPASNPDSLAMYTSARFDFRFDANTFQGSAENIYHYASSSDNSPLPSWLKFENETLRFSGLTPRKTSLAAPPQTFGVKLIASDVRGFSAATASFNVVVGVHELVFGKAEATVQATERVPFNYSALRGSLELDGQVIPDDKIQSVTAETPDWLQFDSKSLVLTGTPPELQSTANVTVTAIDIYADVATAVISINVGSGLFRGPIQDCNATIGDIFTCKLGDDALTTSDVIASSSISPPTQWVNFDAKTFEFRGRVPQNARPRELSVNLTVSSRQGSVSDSRIFRIRLLSAGAKTGGSTAIIGGSRSSTASLLPTMSPTSSVIPSENSNENRNEEQSDKRTRTIVVSVVVPAVVLSAAAIALLLAWRRRSNSKRRSTGTLVRDISKPIEEGDAVDGAMQPRTSSFSSSPRRTRLTDRLRGRWNSSADISQVSGRHQNNYGQEVWRPWNVSGDHLPAGPRSSMATPGSQRFGSPNIDSPSSRSPRSRDQLASPTNFSRKQMLASTEETGRVDRRASGQRVASKQLTLGSPPRSSLDLSLPLGRRIGGIGHGSGGQSLGTDGPRGLGFTGISWRDARRKTRDTMISSNFSLMTESTDVLMFPQPPPLQTQAPSVRLVPKSDTDPSRISASRSERFGHSRVGTSPYWAGSSRASSHSRRPKKRTYSSNRAIPSNHSGRTGNIEQYLRELTGGTSEPESLTKRRSTSHDPSRDAPGSVPTLGSRLSRSFGRMSRQLSNLSTRFQSASSSPGSDVDSDSNWQYTNDEKSVLDSLRTGEGSFGDMLDEQEVEYGVASKAKAPTQRATERRRSALSILSTPRLVEFKDKRPVSVERAGHKSLTMEKSHSASLADINQSGVWLEEDEGSESARSNIFL
ncbi:MAG: hypothetical protein M1825_000835 [Sarcosagium campestre]|nr:MAG: hypothetical protein M1825_000835 [Sarcosagium campestre]